MKILHTGDWHIGRVLNEKNLLEDQRYTLGNLTDLLKSEKPEVLIIAGDIYDRFIPSKEALQLVDEFLSEVILSLKIKTIIVGGNHDGRERLAFSGSILKNQGLYIYGNYSGEINPIKFMDSYGFVNFWPVPFIKPIEYKNIKGIVDTLDYEEMYRRIIGEIKENFIKGERNVLITHGLILGNIRDAKTIDESVRPIEVGGISFANATDFSDFDYVALGHLHRPQKVGVDKIRYSGSLLKYSFSEHLQKKSVTILEINEPGDFSYYERQLAYIRDLRVIEGNLEQLTDSKHYGDKNRQDYIKVVLTDPKGQINPMDKLREVYPNIMELSYKERENTSKIKVSQIKENFNSPVKLFEDFYFAVHKEPLTEEEGQEIKTIFNRLKEEEE